MNLLDTASLVVTPNGYKASKLYSIIPSDGSGDMTFARTGDTATRVNSSGLIETVLANKPRLDYLGSTCPKLLLEPQRSNRCLQSQDISSVYWTQGGTLTIVANTSVAPDGTTTADSIQSANNTTYNNITQIFSVSANSTYTFSVFVKKETTRTNFGGVTLYFLGGTGKIASVAFNEVAGTATNLTDSTITPIIKVDDYGTYWRYSVTATDTGSNPTLITYFYPTISTNGTSINLGTGSARTIWGFQLEEASYATSYIPTTTASVTRNNETLSLSVLPNNDMNFTAILKLANTSQGNTDGDWFQIYYPSAIQGRAYGYSTAIGFADNYNISATFTSNKNLCFKQESGINAKIFTDGVLRATSTSGTYSNAFTRFEIQSANLLRPMNINSFIFYNYALTDQECITITSL